ECSLCDRFADCDRSGETPRCVCRVGYTGDGTTCTALNACEGNPCGSNGYCENLRTSYSCICYSGYTGTHCETDLNDCKVNTSLCDASQDCENTTVGYRCLCEPGFIDNDGKCTEIPLYPYEGIGEVNKGDDPVYGPFYIRGGISYFGKIYHRLFVSMNGYISLGQRYSYTQPPWNNRFPRDEALIAPWFTDIDTTKYGYLSIYNYNVIDSNQTAKVILERASEDGTKYGVDSSFTASHVTVATWYKVPPYPGQTQDENATFQVVMVTDSRVSFVLYNYHPSGMGWNPNNSGRQILIGHSDGGNNSRSIYERPISTVHQRSNVGETGRHYYKLGERTGNDNIKCLEWVEKQPSNIRDLARRAQPCPCSWNQARRDTRFTVDRGSMCVETNSWNNRRSRRPRQKCCYDRNGAIKLGYPGGGYPIIDGSEEKGYQDCCTNSNLCHLFYKQRPSNGCSGYVPPRWGSGRGDPHLITLDRDEYTFNGLGEYVLMKVNETVPDLGYLVDFKLQGRTEKLNPTDNATVFTSFAAKDGTSDNIEVKLKETSIEIIVNGETPITIADGKREEFNNVSVENRENEIIVQFANDIGLKVKVGQGLLTYVVSVPTYYKGHTQGLLGKFNGDGELFMPNGTKLEFTRGNLTEQGYFNYGQTWMLTSETDSRFSYTDKRFEDYNVPSFVPIFFADRIGDKTEVVPDKVKETCGDNLQCQVDYMATNNDKVAKETIVDGDRIAEDTSILEHRPPVFVEIEDALNITINERYIRKLHVNLTGDVTVVFSIETTLPNVTINSTTGEIFWNPTIEYRNISGYAKFYATDSKNASSEYWPAIYVCACKNPSQCNLDYLNENEVETNENKFYRAQCNCSSGAIGEFCEIEECAPGSCYPNVTCTVEPNLPNGFKCGLCPSGLQGNGQKCFDVDECFERTSMCNQTCHNYPGGYNCSCESGYRIASDGFMCEDINECTDTEIAHNCTNPGQYCVNTIGAYFCACDVGYANDGTTCTQASHQYGGQLQFISIPDATKGQMWTIDLLDPTSKAYADLATKVHTVVDGIYKNSTLKTSYVSSQVYEFSQGSIIARFNIFFSGRQDIPTVDQILQDRLDDCPSSPCTLTVSDTTLIGVNSSTSTVQEKDLCVSSLDNNCDKQSTNCTSSEGVFSCSCKTGFEPRDKPSEANICKDINECNLEPSVCTNSNCTNLPGSFSCNCNFGFKAFNITYCEDVCKSNPCQKGGQCQKERSSYRCICPAGISGKNCENEDAAAQRLRLIAIGVGAGVGAFCLVLIIIIVVLCCRRRRQDKPESNFENPTYGTAYRDGVSSHVVSLDSWNPSMLPRAKLKSGAGPDLEMHENSVSQDRFMDDDVRYADPSKITTFNTPNPGRQDPLFDNPAFSPDDQPISNRGVISYVRNSPNNRVNNNTRGNDYF
ncbi:unnamed protein product, partial [Owenia fusiformis]